MPRKFNNHIRHHFSSNYQRDYETYLKELEKQSNRELVALRLKTNKIIEKVNSRRLKRGLPKLKINL